MVRLLAVLSMGFGLVTLAGRLEAAPARVLAPVVAPRALAADGAYGPDGSLHLVLARADGCVHVSRAAGSAGFGPEHAIPAAGQPAVGGERRPHLLADRAGRLFALWQTRQGIVLAVSADAGVNWTLRSTGALTAKTGADVFNAALSADGVLYLVWAGEKDPHLPDDDVAQHLYLASSADGGGTFTEPRAITTDATRACPCCVPAITTGRPGEVWVAYRSSAANIKETRVLASTDAGRTFTSSQLSNHRWEFQGCPMQGPAIAVASPHVIVSWTSNGDMYTSSSSDGGKSYSAPQRLGRGRFNQVVASATGTILQVWDEGTRTGVWWRADAQPSARVSLKPGGALLAAPDGRFELLGSGDDGKHHGH